VQNNTNNTFQTFWVGLGSLSTFLLSIISAAILSRYFDKIEYGTYRQILYVYNTLLVVFAAGLPRVFAYFLPRFPLEQGKDIVWKVSKMLFLLGMVFSIILFSFSGIIAQLLKNSELEIGLKYFSPIPMLLLPTLGIEGIFSAYKKAIYIAIYNLTTRILMLFFIVMPVIIFQGTYLNAIYGWLIVSIISFGIALYFKGIPFKKSSIKKSQLSFKTIFSYSLPLVMASIAGVAIISADQFYISRYFGPETFAEFANGFIDLPFVTMITGAVAVVLMPVFSKVFFENGNINELIATWRSSIRKSALLIYPLVIFFISYAYEIMIILYSSKYAVSSKYFQINMVLNFFNTLVFAPFFLSIGKTKLYSLVHLVFAIIIWVSHFFIIVLFNEPVWIAVNSVVIRIILIITFIYLASRIMQLKITEFLPLITIGRILLQTTLLVCVTKIIQYYFLETTSIFLQVAITFTIYIGLLVATSSIFQLNYLQVLRPLLRRL